MKTFRMGLMAMGFAGALVGQDPAADPDVRPPNIVVFLVDDMGWRDPGFQGGEYHKTPNMDRLAREGVVFTDAYSCGPNCAPSRACLMSGQYSPRHGIYTVGKSTRGKAKNRRLVPTPNRTELPDATVTLAETLRSAGYVCAHMGKWHLGADPMTQGFDVNVAGNRAGHPKSYFSPYRNSDLENGPKGENLTDRLGVEAAQFVADNRDQPFFLHLAFYAVHTPIQAKPELVAEYQARETTELHDNAAYAAMVETTDQAMGAVLDALRVAGVEDNTVVVFTSDNGGHGPVTKMTPLRGSKGMLYEGGIRVPLVVRWLGRIEAGSHGVPVNHLDLYPTLAALAAAPTSNQLLDGVDLSPLLFGSGEIAERDLFWHFPAYLQGADSLTGKGPWRTTPAGAVRSGRFKLLEFFESGRLELYDVVDDPSEASNLAESEPALLKRLHGRLKDWRRDTGAPVPTEPNPDYAGR